jgi:hypothetical protein
MPLDRWLSSAKAIASTISSTLAKPLRSSATVPSSDQGALPSNGQFGIGDDFAGVVVTDEVRPRDLQVIVTVGYEIEVCPHSYILQEAT